MAGTVHAPHDVPHGASGELWIDAPSRFVEYLDNPSATARAIDANGVFRTRSSWLGAAFQRGG